MAVLRNKINRQELRQKLMEETFQRKTVSFYRYVKIKDPQALRDRLYAEWSELGVFGRIYLSTEGINAQFSVPEHNWEAFVENLYSYEEFVDMPFKIAVEDNGKSFFKLTLKVRKKIVADGLEEDEYDVTNVGTHLSAKDFNEKMNDPDAVVVDMRNQYESEVGHFEGALLPDADTFAEELPMAKEMLSGKESKPVLLYCTGGIRCEKASAYLKHHGFENVYQLHGGIIDYKRQIDKEGLECKFKGKNFVFDERVGERITDDVLAHCHQCGATCDHNVNCKNTVCNLLFIQCDTCAERFEGCCSSACQEIAKLPKEEIQELARKKDKAQLGHYKRQVRPALCCERVQSA